MLAKAHFHSLEFLESQGAHSTAYLRVFRGLLSSIRTSQMLLVVKNSSANAGDMKWGFDPWFRKIPQREDGNPLQYCCLKNYMDRGAWGATDHRVTESETTEWPTHTHIHTHSSGSSRTRNGTGVPCIAGRFFTSWATREATPCNTHTHTQLSTYQIVLLWGGSCSK